MSLVGSWVASMLGRFANTGGGGSTGACFTGQCLSMSGIFVERFCVFLQCFLVACIVDGTS